MEVRKEEDSWEGKVELVLGVVGVVGVGESGEKREEEEGKGRKIGVRE